MGLSWPLFRGDEAGVLHALKRQGREAFQFFEERFVNNFKIEARFPLHPRFQLPRATVQQFRITINPRQMKANVGFCLFNPRNRDNRCFHFSAPCLDGRWARRRFQTVMIFGVAADRKLRQLFLQEASQPRKDYIELRAHKPDGLSNVWPHDKQLLPQYQQHLGVVPYRVGLASRTRRSALACFACFAAFAQQMLS
ncbi:MAG TPA: hypothetical protein VFB72_13725 [Verrucomicrobiae bacterium]|nr:hypothetical protein [Verrucomicrobiae bacterium]